VGHAIEAATDYRRFLHGEAVAGGMLAATAIAREQGLLALAEARRIQELVARVGRLPSLPQGSTARILAAMRADKKAQAGKLRWVLPRRIGRVAIGASVPEALVRKMLACLPEILPGGC